MTTFKLQDMEPFVGTFIGVEQGPYSTIYKFNTSKGDIGVYGFNDLDSQMSKINVGDKLRVGFKGKVRTSYNNYTFIANIKVLEEVK